MVEKAGSSLVRVAALVSVILAFTIAWGSWNDNEDLFMALCGGRDVLKGCLGTPDTWSYASNGEVWVNQGWLSHFLLYLSYLVFQDLGPLLVKGLLLVICMVLLYVQSKRLGVATGTNLLFLAIGIAGVAPLISIRAENFAVLCFLILSTVLTAPSGSGQWRYFVSLFVIAVWSNSHGSFLIGFLLITIKCSAQLITMYFAKSIEVERGMNAGSDVRRRAKTELLGWLITAVLCIPVMGLVNPFGLANLLMPFRQVGSELWTQDVPFWAPLIGLNESGRVVLYTGVYAYPFLFLVAALLVLVAIRITKRGRLWFSDLVENDKADLTMHLLACPVMVIMAFCWGRAVILAVGSLIPLLAYLADSFVAGEKIASGDPSVRPMKPASYMLAAAVPGALVWLFFAYTLTAYLPDNPLRPNRPLVKRILGTLPSYMSEAEQFLTKNGIKGRVFTGMVMSDFLLLHVPDITIFMDCRAQSLYSDTVLQEYYRIMGASRRDPGSVADAVNILEHYEVNAVVLETDQKSINLIELLTVGEKWRVIYADFYAVVMVRVESRFVRDFLKHKNVDSLWYPNAATRILSEASLWVSCEKRLPAALESKLKDLAARQPGSLIYNVLWSAGRDQVGCLNPGTGRYFVSELERLSTMDYLRENGVPSILISMMEIVSALQMDQVACRRDARTEYARLKEALSRRLDHVRERYLPWGALQFERDR